MAKTESSMEEIRVGDIVMCVEFLNGTYCINGDRSLFFEANTNEVIGNIFDNQEMLEVE